MSLQSLIYQRGSLAVIDQLELPSKHVYVNVKDSNDAFTVIRTMQVRGAPLIAIVAALGLSVELYQKKDSFSSIEDVSEFLLERMQYLRESRPTAVNLFQAMDQLSSLVRDSSFESVSELVDSFIESCEAIWEADVVTNRAIGDHGAKKILEITGKDKIKVLTICNTGSLATAGYGTALGVVRSLHAMGKLEHVYACETRPYNQGARLTAFEIVQDKLPGTLIADSMASALMAVKGVDCVVVGADRVAANGDTANKIGTYQLAIAAKYHNIPFFTAVPTTSLDLSIANGTLIPIEERNPKELTSIFGIPIAPEGIAVWNPGFDVTPCSLITGVITEIGVAEAAEDAGVDGIIDLPRFLRESKREDLCSLAAIPVGVPSGYKALSEEGVVAYVLSISKLRHILGVSSASELSIQEVGDGNLNFVYILINSQDSSRAVVIKQALPYVRCVGESWPLSLERATFEYHALVEQFKHCPTHVPEVFHFDARNALIAMQYIPSPHIILRKALISGLKFPLFADHLSTFLAQNLFSTSYLMLNGGQFRTQVSFWNRNIAMCSLTEKVIFTDPFMDAFYNRWNSPYLDYFVEAIKTDAPLKLASERMKILFLSHPQALIHADLHTGSIMATEDSTYIIDPEFAFCGPMAFDIASVLSNMLLAYFASAGHGDQAQSDYPEWLLSQIQSFFHGFTVKFMALWTDFHDHAARKGDVYPSSVFPKDEELQVIQQDFCSEIWRDALEFAGVKMIRRIIGIAHVADLECIEDLELRSQCEARCLALARWILTGEPKLSSCEELMNLCRQLYAQPMDLSSWPPKISAI